MRKIVTLLVVVFFILSFTTFTFAAADKNITNKLDRGGRNVVLGWTEIPKSIAETSKNSNAFIGCTFGTIKGVLNAFARTFSGAVDVVTFPVAPQADPVFKALMVPETTVKK